MSLSSGLIAAPFTPMLANGNLNLDLIPEYAAFLARNGISGVYIFGSTGESASLSLREKKALLASWAEHAPENLKVLANIGETSIEHAQVLMKMAKEYELDGVGVVGPYYFKPASVESLVDYCAHIACTAPELPFYYYHIPELTGVHFSMRDFLSKAANKIPNLAGMKFTDYNLMEFDLCKRLHHERFDLFWGKDEVLLAAMAMGANGAVGSTYNYAAPLFTKLIHHFEDGNMEMARKLQQRAIDMIRLLGKYPGSGKAFMKAIGLDFGPYRLPVQNMLPEQLEAFRTDLEKLGFQDFASR